jgi:hypothetical protein
LVLTIAASHESSSAANNRRGSMAAAILIVHDRRHRRKVSDSYIDAVAELARLHGVFVVVLIEARLSERFLVDLRMEHMTSIVCSQCQRHQHLTIKSDTPTTILFEFR